MSQSTQATTSSRTGAPDDALVHPKPANLSEALLANVRQACSCSSLRTLAQNEPADRMAPHVVDSLIAMKLTNGGSSDTEAKVPTVIPTGVPSEPHAVMTVTPVGTVPSTLRNCELSIAAPAIGDAHRSAMTASGDHEPAVDDPVLCNDPACLGGAEPHH
jgi:hypothetical protein